MIILISLCLFLSFLNLIFLLFLSNSIFRLMISDDRPIPISSDKSIQKLNESGLVELKPSLTYDPRFKRQ